VRVGNELDASSLMLACTGFLPGDDPRMRATIDAIAERLTDERGLVYRYRAAAYANDVGLLAEEVDVGGVEMIGNYPLAFSHIGLVNAAWAIAEAELRRLRSAVHPG
jgi:alpha,alpha-trehalase